MIADTEYRTIVAFIYTEARLAAESRYAEWEALWDDDAVYWVPASPMRRLISNIEVEQTDTGEYIAGSNFLLLELSIQAQHETHLWGARIIHKLRQVDGGLKMFWKQVILVNAAEPLPNLTFLI
jgi:3-phenylpropionate/cinnamic acid dioxygenase small subunit